MIVHRVGRERACEIVREAEARGERVTVFARSATEVHWLDEELEGETFELLCPGGDEGLDDEVLADLLAGAGVGFEEMREHGLVPDHLVVIEPPPAAVRTVPVA